MSDKPFNDELDDELLSAYHDGELSADERAAVEARLASDPVAQQLLHELRSVSQSVQALPTENLGRDLSDEIVRRAREAKQIQGATTNLTSATASGASSPGDTLPQIRIFGSKRAWFWASMALAAGLLMMIVRSGDEPANKLPPIAARDRQEAQFPSAQQVADSRRPTRREVAKSAAPEAPSPPPAAVAFDDKVQRKVDDLGTMPSGTSEEFGDRMDKFNRGRAAAAPPVPAASPAPNMRENETRPLSEAAGSSSTSTAQPSQLAADKRMPGLQPKGDIAAATGAPETIAEKQKSAPMINRSNTQPTIVVRVVAKPEALKNGSFERLLADNKIEFVREPEQNHTRSFGGGKLETPGQSESKLKQQLSKTAERHSVDAVLVEAPAPAIESCLADLNKNSSDFLSIAVNEQPQSGYGIDAKSTPTKKLAENTASLRRFNRGTVPVIEKNTTELRDYYGAYNKPMEPAAKDSPRGDGFGAESAARFGTEQDSNIREKLTDKSEATPEIRRARHVQTWNANDDRQAGEPTSLGLSAPTSSGRRAVPDQAQAKAVNQPTSQRAIAGKPEAKTERNDTMKVLFVFTSAETPASSAPPDNRPK